MTTDIVILISVLVSGLLTIFILNSIVNSRIKNKISENKTPIAVDILKAILFLSGGLLLSEITTSFQTLTKVLPASFTGNDLLLKEFSYFSIFLGITVLTTFLIVWLSTLMYSLISKGKSIFIEVANNNLNAVIIFIGLILALTIATKTGLTPLFDQFIPYPTMPIYH
ncbi:MAG TPA: hypothetical protein PKN63_09440 [Chitinophagales bacterium]|nr:hypothetical protein [Chitinophagales bacterium]